MLPDAHYAFTAQLLERLASDPDVLGLVTLGSTSGLPPLPDAFSDHDFFVVTRPGAQERLRGDLGWLPDAAAIALSFRETAHGLKVLYGSGHLAEFAVFDLDELALARINRYTVLLDRADVGHRLAQVRRATLAAAPGPVDPAWEAGQLLTNLVVGAGRYARGERLSGHTLVRVGAVSHLVKLVRAGLSLEAASPLDDLDPMRRLEQALPAEAAELDRALALPVLQCARAVLALARHARPELFPPLALAAVERQLARSEAAAGMGGAGGAPTG